MINCGKHVAKDINLEDWLASADERCFPKYSTARGERPYPERYREIKRTLKPIYDSIEKNALAVSASDWINSIIDSAEHQELNSAENPVAELVSADPLVYLNDHGIDHVEKVINWVSILLSLFSDGFLTPYEGFLLLVAILVHDTGNVFGRDDHEKRIKQILDQFCVTFIPDNFERTAIEDIAIVHGGKIYGKKDTINILEHEDLLHNAKIRKRLLSALLRFGDELADDSSRADGFALSNGVIPESSKIFHYYSKALHSVTIQLNPVNKQFELHLAYEFDSDVAQMQFMKYGSSKYLLDEIYDRTKKMECERRYCMRFLRPYLHIDSIKVVIVIRNRKSPPIKDRIDYTLEENGYPTVDQLLTMNQSLRTGAEQIRHMRDMWETL